MSQKQTYSLWLRPFGDIAYSLHERIKKLSAQHDTPVFEPHVTLLGGLAAGETALTQLTDTLASSLHPFEILLTRAGYTDSFYQSLFVHAEKSEELVKARRNAERLFDVHPEEEFMPHLSLLYGNLTRREKERILNVMGREFHTRFPVHNLLLIETTGKPESWKKIHSAEFKS
ncbi:2'-5' RNA ligase family protein [Halalkalibaculum sp. DA3122]|uniref:2'-5' RNA ligase family protein n=1 Tax=unclassified Halalkalibaculum TaxID=2964617 RepID=UPI003754EB82